MDISNLKRMLIQELGEDVVSADSALLNSEDFKLVVASTDKIYAAFFSW